MEDNEIRELIIDRLAKGVSSNDVILEVCNRTGLKWPDAERLVAEEATEDGATIADRQLPLLAALSSAVLVAGVALIGWFTAVFIEPLLFTPQSSSLPDSLKAAAILTWIAANAQFFGNFILGAAMIAGGILGLKRAGIRLSVR